MVYGSIGAAGLLGCVWYGPVTFGLFFGAVQAVMLREFYRMMRAGGSRPATGVGIMVGVLIFAVINVFIVGYPDFAKLFGWPVGWTTYPPLSALPQAVPEQSGPGAWATLMLTGDFSFPIVWFSGVGVFMVVLVLREIVLWPKQGQPFTNIGATVTGLLYVSLPMALFAHTAFGPEGYDYRRVFALLFLVWASDIGAYAAGKTFGRRKLAPNISPAKTWEGWAGGFLLTLWVGWLLQFLLPDVPLPHLLTAAAVVAVFGPLGDLAESMLKRSVGVKDSGTFLPGHGGLLDRFDAFLLVLPVLALLQLLAGR